jgi:hypothetical protein
MARFLKNTQLKGGSYSIQLPLGTSSVGPESPVDAQIRFNQTNNKIEFYYNGQWNQVAKIGQVPIYMDTFTTYDDISASNQFTMTNAPRDYLTGEETSVMIFVGGVQQKAGVNYTFSSSVPSKELYLTPSSSGDAGQPVIVLHNINSTDAA